MLGGKAEGRIAPFGFSQESDGEQWIAASVGFLRGDPSTRADSSLGEVVAALERSRGTHLPHSQHGELRRNPGRLWGGGVTGTELEGYIGVNKGESRVYSERGNSVRKGTGDMEPPVWTVAELKREQRVSWGLRGRPGCVKEEIKIRDWERLPWGSV